MKTLLEGNEAVADYKESEKGIKNAENEQYRVPVGTFLFGKFRKVEQEMDDKIAIYFVYPLFRDGIEVGQVSISQIEKTALYDFDTSCVKKRNVEQYFLIPQALKPLMEVDKVALAGKTVTISISDKIGYKVPFTSSEGYPKKSLAESAWTARTAKRVYDMVIA